MSNITDQLVDVLVRLETAKVHKKGELTWAEKKYINMIREKLNEIAGTDKMGVDRLIRNECENIEKGLVWKNPSYIRSAPLISVTEPFLYVEAPSDSDIENKRVFECSIGNTLALMTVSKQEAEDLYGYFSYQLSNNIDYVKNNLVLYKNGCEVMVSCIKDCVNNFITLKLK